MQLDQKSPPVRTVCALYKRVHGHCVDRGIHAPKMDFILLGQRQGKIGAFES